MAEESAAARELLWGGYRPGREIRDADRRHGRCRGSRGREMRVRGQVTLGTC